MLITTVMVVIFAAQLTLAARLGRAGPQCPIVYDRINCGQSGISAGECTSRGCCWEPCENCDKQVPWCFLSMEMMTTECMVPNEERDDCGYYGMTQRQCLERDCCWTPSDNINQPWCFKQLENEIPSTPRYEPYSTPYMFTCDNGNTVYSSFICDGDNTCGDCSDESANDCTLPCTIHDMFTCDNGELVYSSYICDGDNDCGDCSDESANDCTLPCTNLEVEYPFSRCAVSQDCYNGGQCFDSICYCTQDYVGDRCQDVFDFPSSCDHDWATAYCATAADTTVQISDGVYYDVGICPRTCNPRCIGSGTYEGSSDASGDDTEDY